MAVIETWFKQDLQKAVQVKHLEGSLFSGNANGNRIGVIVTNNGAAASLSGTVSGYAVLADGTSVPCTGSLSGNRASVLLPAAAYKPGIVFISVFLTSGSTVTTLAAVAANVQQARTDSQVSPGSAVTDWTQTINAAMQSVVDSNAANMAVEYGSLTYPVPVGKYTIYNDLLYRCTTPIASSESWTASHWTRVRIADDVADLKSANDEYRIGSQKFQSYYKHTLALIVGYYNNRGVLVETDSGWKTTEKLSTTAVPSLSTNPSYCQIWENGNYIGQYNYADFGSLPTFDTIAFTWNKNNVPASGIVLTPIGEMYTTLASVENEISEVEASVTEMNDEISVNKQDFDDFADSCFTSERKVPINLYNIEAATFGKYCTNTGLIADNSSYAYSDYIPVTPGKTYTRQRGTLTVSAGGRAITSTRWISCYDSNKNILPDKGSVDPTSFTVPDGVAYLRISSASYMQADTNPTFVEGNTLIDYSPYFEPYTLFVLKDTSNSPQTRQNTQDIADLQEQIGTGDSAKCIFTAKAATLTANQNLICCNSCDNKKNEYIELTAKFSTFGELTIAHGKGSYMGGYITITASKLLIYTYNGTQIEEYDHGLTIANFINVIIFTNNDASCRSKITIMSSGGDYTASTTRYYSCRAAVLCNATFAMTDVQMKYTVNDAKEDVWVFGDSYISMGDPNRWATQAVLDGHIKMMLHGFGGAMSMNEIVPFRALLDVARPKFIVWTLGMNDGDTSSAVNTNWKTCVDEVIATCEAKGITLILATIPNVPNVRNTFKNAYVKSTGLRYVDFAKAVNAESAGATWYEGMLSSDNTHPNALGAKALMRQFLQDVPEVLYAED